MVFSGMNVPFNYHTIDQPEYYVLTDGRMWSISKSKFVDAVPEGFIPDTCGNGTVEDLLYMLRWNKYPLGELATEEDLAKEAREKRNQLISATDYLVMPDYPLPEDKRQAVLAYRQALRDVPEQTGFPRQIDWPVKP